MLSFFLFLFTYNSILKPQARVRDVFNPPHQLVLWISDFLSQAFKFSIGVFKLFYHFYYYVLMTSLFNNIYLLFDSLFLNSYLFYLIL